jgi:hypothetical protein
MPIIIVLKNFEFGEILLRNTPSQSHHNYCFHISIAVESELTTMESQERDLPSKMKKK